MLMLVSNNKDLEIFHAMRSTLVLTQYPWAILQLAGILACYRSDQILQKTVIEAII